MNISKLVTDTASDALDGLKKCRDQEPYREADIAPLNHDAKLDRARSQLLLHSKLKSCLRNKSHEAHLTTEKRSGPIRRRTENQQAKPPDEEQFPKHRGDPATRTETTPAQPNYDIDKWTDHPRATAETTAPYLQRRRRPTGKDKPCAQEAHRRSHADPEKTSKAEISNRTRREAKGKHEGGRRSPAGAGRALTRCRTRGESEIWFCRRADKVERERRLYVIILLTLYHLSLSLSTVLYPPSWLIRPHLCQAWNHSHKEKVSSGLLHKTLVLFTEVTFFSRFQAVLSIVAIAICSFLTPNASSTVTGLLLTEGTITLLLYSSLIMAIFYVPELNKDLIWALRRAVRIRYHIILFCLRAAGIILVLRALSLFWERPREGRQHQRLRYRRVLHIITMCKLMNLPDVLSVADSLLAVAVMISAKLELATKFTNPVRICATNTEWKFLDGVNNSGAPLPLSFSSVYVGRGTTAIDRVCDVRSREVRYKNIRKGKGPIFHQSGFFLYEFGCALTL
ncbi:hypothetical protein Bca101_003707 [Brassica carinata]